MLVLSTSVNDTSHTIRLPHGLKPDWRLRRLDPRSYKPFITLAVGPDRVRRDDVASVAPNVQSLRGTLLAATSGSFDPLWQLEVVMPATAWGLDGWRYGYTQPFRFGHPCFAVTIQYHQT